MAVAAARAIARRLQSICVGAGVLRLRLGVGSDVSCGLVVFAEQYSVWQEFIWKELFTVPQAAAIFHSEEDRAVAAFTGQTFQLCSEPSQYGLTRML